jgi:hypothetical protein
LALPFLCPHPGMPYEGRRLYSSLALLRIVRLRSKPDPARHPGNHRENRFCDEFTRYLAIQIWRLAKAMTSEKLASDFLYHAHSKIGMVLSLSISMAIRTTIENIANRPGVVPAMAQSDHCRCVSTPRWARSSSNVTSSFQRSINHWRTCTSVASRFVQKNASVRNFPSGSRTTTHLMGTGSCLGVYHRETPENISRVRFIPSYQTTLIGVHTVEGSWFRANRERCFLPFLGFGPRLPGCSRVGKSYKLASIQKRATKVTGTDCGTPNMSNLLMVDYVSPPLAKITQFVSSKMPQQCVYTKVISKKHSRDLSTDHFKMAKVEYR